MSETRPPGAAGGPRPTPEGPGRARLDRAPGERYQVGPGGATPAGPATGPATTTLPAGSRARAVAAVALSGVVGAVGFAILGSFDLGPGLLAAAAFVGWAVALAGAWGAGTTDPATRRFRLSLALVGAAASMVAALALLWAWSHVEGGVLGPLDYLDQRFGPLAWLDVLAAIAAAGLRAR